jgi:hypothetical protein
MNFRTILANATLPAALASCVAADSSPQNPKGLATARGGLAATPPRQVECDARKAFTVTGRVTDIGEMSIPYFWSPYYRQGYGNQLDGKYLTITSENAQGQNKDFFLAARPTGTIYIGDSIRVQFSSPQDRKDNNCITTQWTPTGVVRQYVNNGGSADVSRPLVDGVITDPSSIRIITPGTPTDARGHPR